MAYEPIPVEVRMGQHGYWIVTVSVTPWQRMSVMLAFQGQTPDQAKEAALTSLSGLSSSRRRQE